MMNQVTMVGRLTTDVDINTLENGKDVASITIAIPRSYKNTDGEYETDFIKCTLWGNIAKNTAEYCKKGDCVGIRGHIQSKDNKLELVAEKITFLTSKKIEEEKDSLEYDENIKI